MTRIKERCDKYKFYSNPHLAAIESATEQKTIDIENVREWVNDNKQPVLASETDDTVVGYSISVEEFIKWLKTMEK